MALGIPDILVIGMAIITIVENTDMDIIPTVTIPATIKAIMGRVAILRIIPMTRNFIDVVVSFCELVSSSILLSLK